MLKALPCDKNTLQKFPVEQLR